MKTSGNRKSERKLQMLRRENDIEEELNKELSIEELKKEVERLTAELEKEKEKSAALQKHQDDSLPQEKKGSRLPGILSNIVFYLIIIGVVLGAFLLSGDESSPRNVFGYSYFTVLSPSMQREIPKGALVITKHIDPEEIRLGDDITFFKDETTTVTHRVIEIYEDYQETGQPGFRTKGIENPGPDNDIVSAPNVIGVVQFIMPGAGAALAYIKSNFWLVSIICVLLLLLSVCIKVYIANGEKKEKTV